MWFSGLVVTKAFHPPNEDHDHLLHIYALMVEADDVEAATAALAEQGRELERSYLNGDGELVDWRVVEICEVQRLEPTLTYGAVLHSYYAPKHRALVYLRDDDDPRDEVS